MKQFLLMQWDFDLLFYGGSFWDLQKKVLTLCKPGNSSMNQVSANGSLPYRLKTSEKILHFLMFSGSIVEEHWLKMVLVQILSNYLQTIAKLIRYCTIAEMFACDNKWTKTFKISWRYTGHLLKYKYPVLQVITGKFTRNALIFS